MIDEFTKLDNDQQLKLWLHAKLNDLLSLPTLCVANTPEMAAEVYMSSEMVRIGRRCLDELARHLKLGPGLKAELERQVRLAFVEEEVFRFL